MPRPYDGAQGAAAAAAGAAERGGRALRDCGKQLEEPGDGREVLGARFGPHSLLCSVCAFAASCISGSLGSG